MKTVLVTGGAGFIGSNFVNYLYKKYPDYRIIVIDCLTYAGNPDNFSGNIKQNNGRFTFWYGDVKNADLVNDLAAKADIVVHFAAETHVARSIFDNRIFYETDILGTQVVANAVLKNSRSIEKFIHISSSEVYGTALNEPMTEDHILNPLSPYASAKAGADRLVYSYCKTYNIPAVILRPFNNYGFYQHLEKVIPRFITAALLNEPLTVHGDGRNSRDWVFVEDNCRAIDLIMHCDTDKISGEVINIGTGCDIDIFTIANIILDKLKKPASLIKYVGDRPGQVKKHISSIRKIKELAGWEPTIEFERGLDITIDWYASNQKWWEKLLWMRSIPIITKNGKMENH